MTSRAFRAAGSLALLASALLVAPAASAAPRSDVTYDALGDSYASGYGVGPYSACGRSDAAYAVQVNGRMRIDLDNFASCAGAKTTDVTANQLQALDGDTDLVTISIGGNDIGWSTAITACLGGTDAQCKGALTLTRAAITNRLPALLDTVYAQIAERAPDTHVVVIGYPRLFSPEYGPYLGASVAEQQDLNEGADLLNSVIAAKAADYGFQFVDVTERFLGHGVNSPESWIVGPLAVGAFHPNAAGYQAYTAAVTAAIRPSALRR